MVQNPFWPRVQRHRHPLAAGAASAWGVVLSPAVGALLMSLSTIVVALNATLLRGIVLEHTSYGPTKWDQTARRPRVQREVKAEV
jgi:hypothetical protein